jgi:UV DNA damage endonuclease
MIGYACINMELSERGITTNRSMIKKTFLEKGIVYASELALLNVQDLEKIIHWNLENNILFFRMSSDIFPWSSEYDLEDLPNFKEIHNVLKRIGDFSKEHNIRLTMHPGPFNVLGSPNEKVVKNTIKDLETHGKIFDLMGLSRTPYNKINIHCNGTYGNKEETMLRFCERFQLLSDSVKSRLTVENDDSKNCYGVKDLMLIHNTIGIPIVFDYHHFLFNTNDLSEEEALEMAISTWGDIVPVVHYSESKSLHESNSKIRPQAHSDYVSVLPNTYGKTIDIMVEAKAKERAILSLREKNIIL